MSLRETIENAFEQYAGMTITDRAICDVRDMLKPSARMSMYAQYIEKITYDRPHKKSQKSVAAAMDHFYVHGDMSLYPMLARLGKPFAMRYVLEDFQGITGTIEEPDNEAASRYTEMRLGPLADYLFGDIEKNTINKWYDNYAGEEKYPAVLPSKGFYNIVNGTSGIATGISSSIPQFNLIEVNEALIKLLNNPDINDNEIICMPDFAGGGILLNADEVRQSLLEGKGASCKLRAKVEYDKIGHRLIITETPYGIYTGSILKQLKEIAQSEDNPGIERPLDFSTTTANIEIEINKKANVDKIIKYLYKNTFIQYHYPINLIMLDNGKFPKVFTWKQALQAHIDHEYEVYRRGFDYDLRKIQARLHILEGLIKCCARIEEVVQTIKTASNPSLALQKNFELDEVQAKAVLDMKLSRIAHLEVEKLQHEYDELSNEAARIKSILGSNDLMRKEIENGLREVSKKFGDARRTKILNLTNSEEEPTEIRQLQISITNKGNLYAIESSTLYTQKRGGVGAKVKLEKGEYFKDSITANTSNTILLFSKSGNYYSLKANEIPIDQKMPACALLRISDSEEITTITPYAPKNNILFFTKNGIVKKSLLNEYNTMRTIGVKALTLEPDDEIVNILFTDNEPVGILTEGGHFLMINTEDIRAIGRTARGIQGIKLNTDDKVASARVIKKSAKEIVSVSGMGYIKRTGISEFSIQGKNTKGAKLQKMVDDDWMADFLPINDLNEIVVSATSSVIKLKIEDIPRLSKGAIGNKAIKLAAKDNVIGLE